MFNYQRQELSRKKPESFRQVLLRVSAGLLAVLLAAAPLLMVLTAPVTAEAKDSKERLVITDYSTDISFRLDNSVAVTERIDVQFNSYRHGIKLIFPWQTYDHRPMILRGLKTNRFYIMTRESPSLFDFIRAGIELVAPGTLKLEDPHALVGGTSTAGFGLPFIWAKKHEYYEASYIYEQGRDTSRKKDEVYWNIISNARPYLHERVHFKIHLPKKLPSNTRIYFLVGDKKNTQENRVEYKVKGNTIEGRLKGELLPKQALTVKFDLPEGYFSEARPVSLWRYYWYRYVRLWDFLPLLAIPAAWLIWRRFGKPRRPVPVVEFYPPLNTNSAEAAWLLFGNSLVQDFTTLIVYWADQGYLEIEELSKGKDLRLRKLVKTFPAQDYEQELFTEMFRHGNGDTVKISQLNKTFYSDLRRASRRMKYSYRRNTATNPMSADQAKANTLIGLTAAAAFIVPVWFILRKMLFRSDFLEGAGLAAMTLFVLLFLGLIIKEVMFDCDLTPRMRKRQAKRGRLTPGFHLNNLFPKLMVVVLFSLGALYFNALISYLMALIAVKFCGRLILRVDKRTEIGRWYVDHLLGFRTFIQTAELDRIKVLAEQNPEYFYHVLPYAMTLEVSDIWIQKFKTIAVPPPQWYKSSDPDRFRDSYEFNRNLASVLTASSRVMSEAPKAASSDSSSSGSDSSSSSSGGYAGGGSGGTGMSDW